MLLRITSSPIMACLEGMGNPSQKSLKKSVSYGSASIQSFSVKDDNNEIAESLLGMRRVRSDSDIPNAEFSGPLEPISSQTLSNYDDFNVDGLKRTFSIRKHSRRGSLKSMPSFSVYCDKLDEEESGEDDDDDDNDELFGSVDYLLHDFSFEKRDFSALERDNGGINIGLVNPATDSDSGGPSRNNSNGVAASYGDDNGREGFKSLGDYFRQQLYQDPHNALLLRNYAQYLYEVIIYLLLRNYAQYLYETKKDTEKAERYYVKAIRAQPDDGEVIAEYGKFIWEVYHDEKKAMRCFEEAIKKSPDDCYVHGARASFLWDAEEEDCKGEAEKPDGKRQIEVQFSNYLVSQAYSAWQTEEEEKVPKKKQVEAQFSNYLASQAYSAWQTEEEEDVGARENSSALASQAYALWKIDGNITSPSIAT